MPLLVGALLGAFIWGIASLVLSFSLWEWVILHYETLRFLVLVGMLGI